MDKKKKRGYTMDYGVTITRGAAPWQIFQQGPDGTACIRLEGKYHLVHLSQELPPQFRPCRMRKRP
ncbi:MAG: hypothetical protein ACLRI7_02130 [Ruthenibacterium lactatiformans]